MADVTLDLQNTDPKELYGQGVRAFVLQDFDTAVRAFSKASELWAAEYGDDIHDSLGDVYLYYGKSLLELSRKESGPLGEGVLKNVEEESEEEVEESEETEKVEEEDESKANGEVNKTDDQKSEDKSTEQAKTEDKSTEESKGGDKSTEESKGEDKPTEESGDAKANEEVEDEPAEDLQVAWEVLELAKRIFTNRGSDGQKSLAETLIILGEISLESGNFSSAIEDIVQGLEIQKKLFGNDSRTIAETYYKLGGAYSTNAQIDEAVESFKSSLEYLHNKVETLKKDKEANAEEIEEIQNLVPEIEEKIADMENVKKEIANKVKTSADESVAKTNGASEAASSSSSKQVNDISHLVKRKRKGEDSNQEETPAKRPSP